MPLHLLLVLAFASASPAALAQATAGTLDVSFVYMAPTTIEPSYHTAMWLEDEQGVLVKTLYVTNDLSTTGYKVGDACPDWVKQAHWETAEKSAVDAVTGPTPMVGAGRRAFDLAALGVAPGRYRFNLQVHITDAYNIRYRGVVIIGGAGGEVPLEISYSPAKPPGGSEFVRDVVVRYLPR